MEKYTKKPIDYTGCDPNIQEALEDGNSILCDCWCSERPSCRDECVIIVYNRKSPYPYISDDNMSFGHATPIIKFRKAKSFTKIAKYLDDNGYVCNGKGEWVTTGKSPKKLPNIVYPGFLFCYCGREIPDGVFFPEEWLETE